MSDPATLLVADDDPGLRESLERTLTREGYRVLLASDGRAALERVQGGGIDLIVTDLKMPGLTGLELLRAAKAIAPDLDVILLTAFGTVEEAVKAMKDGAYDFLTKPFRREQLLKLIDKALERRQLIEKNKALQQRLDDLLGQGTMIGASPAFRRMMTLVEQVADSSATVLVLGESGAGKEGVARAIHQRSARKNGPFVAVNCASLPENLLESELFGYEKGAFTGAAGRKEGRFELADTGTLFLDEIGDMDLTLQARLLRVLEDGRVRRIGETHDRAVDVRVIAASNKDLNAMAQAGTFREDLYFRLASVPIDMPSLRERPGDVPLLVRHYLDRFCTENRRRHLSVEPEAAALLERYPWPGNIRELRNVCEQLAIFGTDPITVGQLPLSICEPHADRESGVLRIVETAPIVPLRDFKEQCEKEYIESVLRRTDWNFVRAAKLLQIQRTYLHQKIASLAIEKPNRG